LGSLPSSDARDRRGAVWCALQAAKQGVGQHLDEDETLEYCVGFNDGPSLIRNTVLRSLAERRRTAWSEACPALKMPLKTRNGWENDHEKAWIF